MDGDYLHAPRPAWRWRGALCPGGVLRHRVARCRAVRRNPCSSRHCDDAAARQRAPGAARARPHDACEPPVRRCDRANAALHTAGAAAPRRVAPRHHRLLCDVAVAGDAAPAVVLDRRVALRGFAGGKRSAARRGPLDDGVGLHRAAWRRGPTLALPGLQPFAGGAQGSGDAVTHR